MAQDTSSSSHNQGPSSSDQGASSGDPRGREEALQSSKMAEMHMMQANLEAAMSASCMNPRPGASSAQTAAQEAARKALQDLATDDKVAQGASSGSTGDTSAGGKEVEGKGRLFHADLQHLLAQMRDRVQSEAELDMVSYIFGELEMAQLQRRREVWELEQQRPQRDRVQLQHQHQLQQREEQQDSTVPQISQWATLPP